LFSFWSAGILYVFWAWVSACVITEHAFVSGFLW
jgi:hypothetical protein